MNDVGHSQSVATGNTGIGPAALALLAVLAGILLLFRDTLASVVAIWRNSETYAHGWIIVPIAVWLIWRQRDCLKSIRPRFNVAGLGLMGASVLLWAMADIVGAEVVKHLTLVFFIWSAVLAMLGWQATRQMSFPLGYLLFAVPVGEMLIPTLMEITAVFSVTAVELTGIPVYRDGMFFALPSGDFEIAIACSGIRYLIASVALGTLYAYLSFRTLWKRILFMLLSVLVPIVANGIRAYLIVMIAHFSDMRLAVGIDHFIYGWLFFGLVMFVLFLIGARFQEPSPPVVARGGSGSASPFAVIAVAGVALLAIAAGLPASATAMRNNNQAQAPAVSLARASGEWTGPLQPTIDYRPAYRGAAQQVAARYTGPAGDVHVFIEYFDPKDGQAELINDLNRIYTSDWVREDIGERRRTAQGHTVIATPLRRRAGQLLVWHWYEVNGKSTVSGSMVKLRKLRDTLLGRFDGGAMVAVVAEDDGDGTASATLEAFMDSNLDSLRACLYGQAERGRCDAP